MKTEKDLRLAFASLSPQHFERVCCQLLRLYSNEYIGINSNLDALGKTKPGTPDAYVRDNDGRYIALQFTTQKDRVREKVLSDINKLSSDKCHFTDKIHKVTICITTNPSSEIELFYNECEKLGWQCHIFTLDKLVTVSQNHPEFCQQYLNVFVPSQSEKTAIEQFFLCGERIKELREERKLSSSRFIDLIEHYSELDLLKIELNEQECPSSLIEKVSVLTGAEVNWIKHGEGKKYLVESLPYYAPEISNKTIEINNPKELYFCLNTDNFDMYLIVKCNENKWIKYYFDYSLDFWDWYGDLHYIPQIFNQLKSIYESFDKSGCWVRGRTYNNKNFQLLENSEDNFLGNLLEKLPKQGENWIDDIRDIHHRYPISDRYESIYGAWFIDMQKYFRKSV